MKIKNNVKEQLTYKPIQNLQKINYFVIFLIAFEVKSYI